jgi:arsenate reductase-like glutaredoxin family protein
MSCKNAQEFLESLGATVTTKIDAKKVKLAEADALALAKKVETIHAARGKRLVTFNMKVNKPADAILLEHLIGRSGNLRAPAAIIGKTLIVGFNGALYRRILGA